MIVIWWRWKSKMTLCVCSESTPSMPAAPRLTRAERGRLDVLRSSLADLQARNDHGRDLADLGHAVHGRGAARAERERRWPARAT